MVGEQQVMPIRTIWSQPTFYQVASITLSLAIPMLTGLAWRGWARHVPKDLPRWRSITGAISILSTFLSWLSFLGPFLLHMMGIDVRRFAEGCLSAAFLFTFLGISLAFALRGSSRALVLLAGLSMILVMYMNISF